MWYLIVSIPDLCTLKGLIHSGLLTDLMNLALLNSTSLQSSCIYYLLTSHVKSAPVTNLDLGALSPLFINR